MRQFTVFEALSGFYLPDVQDDITNTRAVVVKWTNRIEKMKAKGYTIDYSRYFQDLLVVFNGVKRQIKIVNPMPHIPHHGLPEKVAKCGLCNEPFDGEKAIRIDDISSGCICANQLHFQCFVCNAKDGVWTCPKCLGATSECICGTLNIVASMGNLNVLKICCKVCV
jgi:hypothetical protein